MNQRCTGSRVVRTLPGFLQYEGAEGVSQRTMVAYEDDLKLWIEHVGDLDVAEVHSGHILSFLSYLRMDYVPRRIAGDNSRKLTPKTIHNIYVSLASFFRWASRELHLENPVKGIPRPRVPADPPVEPFRKEEVKALIKACDFSQEAVTDAASSSYPPVRHAPPGSTADHCTAESARGGRAAYRIEDVRHIVLTQMHFDHGGGLPDFAKARVRVHRCNTNRSPVRLVTGRNDMAASAAILHRPEFVLYEDAGEPCPTLKRSACLSKSRCG